MLKIYMFKHFLFSFLVHKANILASYIHFQAMKEIGFRGQEGAMGVTYVSVAPMPFILLIFSFTSKSFSKFSNAIAQYMS